MAAWVGVPELGLPQKLHEIKLKSSVRHQAGKRCESSEKEAASTNLNFALEATHLAFELSEEPHRAVCEPESDTENIYMCMGRLVCEGGSQSEGDAIDTEV